MTATPTATGGVLGAGPWSREVPLGRFEAHDVASDGHSRRWLDTAIALVMKGSPVRVRPSACPQAIRRCAALGGTFRRIAVKGSVSRRVFPWRGEHFTALRRVSADPIPGGGAL